ncbi:MAG: transposase, partial [Acidobacteria bacterium]|nr:transposase [Acidobacteriota bacterium]
MDKQWLNTATFIGIDCHPTVHTAIAINRFEDEKSLLTFPNSREGITDFLVWLQTIETDPEKVVVGVEGGGNSRHALLANLLKQYTQVYEVNPLYTKQRRTFGTKPDKSDPRDAKLIAEVLTRKLSELPRITQHDLSSQMLILRKTVWFFEQITAHGVALQNQLHQLRCEYALSMLPEERKILGFLISQR